MSFGTFLALFPCKTSYVRLGRKGGDVGTQTFLFGSLFVSLLPQDHIPYYYPGVIPSHRPLPKVLCVFSWVHH